MDTQTAIEAINREENWSGGFWGLSVYLDPAQKADQLASILDWPRFHGWWPDRKSASSESKLEDLRACFPPTPFDTIHYFYGVVELAPDLWVPCLLSNYGLTCREEDGELQKTGDWLWLDFGLPEGGMDAAYCNRCVRNGEPPDPDYDSRSKTYLGYMAHLFSELARHLCRQSRVHMLFGEPDGSACGPEALKTTELTNDYILAILPSSHPYAEMPGAEPFVDGYVLFDWVLSDPEWPGR